MAMFFAVFILRKSFFHETVVFLPHNSAKNNKYMP